MSAPSPDVGDGCAPTALPSVAICIPTFNQADYLQLAVASATEQTYHGPLEIWIGDDASTDGTAKLLDGLERGDARIRVLRQPRNVGIARNTSLLLRGPSAEFLVRLDSDDLLMPRFVERLVSIMLTAPLAAYGHTDVVEIDADGRRGRIRSLARRSGLQNGDAALRAALTGYRTTANILIFRASALAAANYYDERPEYVEDYDLAISFAAAGFGNVYLGEPLACYRGWTDSAGVRNRRKALQLRGYRHILGTTLEQAWDARGWDSGPIKRQRARVARRHCASCFASAYGPAETRELVALLRDLGDGPRLEARIMLCRAGLAGSLSVADRLSTAGKRAVKRLLRRTHLL